MTFSLCHFDPFFSDSEKFKFSVGQTTNRFDSKPAVFREGSWEKLDRCTAVVGRRRRGSPLARLE